VAEAGDDAPLAGSTCKTIVATENVCGSLTTMSGRRTRRSIVPGTLDLLILRTLLFGPVHGHGIGKHIRQISEDVLQVEHGSLYPALQRLERDGFIVSAWKPDARGRDMKFYRLTPAGRKLLTVEESRWKQIVRAMGRLLRPV
jgi:PadR family transcriptional regulator, regulatory protein PadR